MLFVIKSEFDIIFINTQLIVNKIRPNKSIKITISAFSRNCMQDSLVNYYPLVFYHNMSLKISFRIHKSPFSLFTALKKHNIFSNISKLTISEMNESDQLQVTGDHQSGHIRQFFSNSWVLRFT